MSIELKLLVSKRSFSSILVRRISFIHSFNRSIIHLFSLDAKDVVDTSRVSELREKVCMSLASYCKKAHSDDVARFAKLLLRMPPIRGWCIKGIENLFFAGAVRSADADIIHMIRNRQL